MISKEEGRRRGEREDERVRESWRVRPIKERKLFFFKKVSFKLTFHVYIYLSLYHILI